MSNLSSGFIDLATFDDIESFLYAGHTAVTYFIRQHKKSSWFTQVPVVLTNSSGTPDFGASWSVNISRAGDYLLHTWLEVTTPIVPIGGAPTANTDPIRFWVKNFMHNLIEECTITFNDLIAHKMDNVSLDFWAAFNVPAGKRDAYRKMIGAGVYSSDGQFVVGVSAAQPQTFVLPLPFFFTRESGVALPTAAIPYNDMRINFKFRALNELLAVYNSNAISLIPAQPNLGVNYALPAAKIIAKVYANYAIVSNDERQLMGSTPRDIVIEQNQSAPITSLISATAVKAYDIRFSHAVKTLNFAIRNKRLIAVAQVDGSVGRTGYGGDFLSNYTRKSLANETIASGVLVGAAPTTIQHVAIGAPYIRKSAISSASLLYENTTRLSDMPSYYFTRVNPYYHQTTVPTEEGIHSYSYSLDSSSVDPMGSTNYGKLTNVSLSITPASGINLSTGATTGGTENLDDLTAALCDVVICAVNHNVIRVSGGAVGFPVL